MSRMHVWKKPLFLFALCSAAVICTAKAQEPAKSSPPTEQPEQVLRITSNLVQTDVMVFDRQGRFVEGLKAEQFELRVDGKPQPISFFEPVKAGSTDEVRKIAAASRAATSARAGSDNGAFGEGRTLFFYFDDLHLQPDSLTRGRDAVSHFIENDMQYGDRAAILTASGQLGILQQLTAEKAVLRLALKRLSPRNYGTGDTERTPMSVSQALAIEKGDRTVIDYFVQQLGKEENLRTTRGARTPQRDRMMGTGSRQESTVRARAQAILDQVTALTTNTLATLDTAVRASGAVAGRKVFFYLSDGFSVNDRTADARQRLQQLTDAAARSGAVIYTVEARGLVTGQPGASQRVAFDNTGRVSSLDTKAVTDAHEPLLVMAKETGGRALLNSNDFAGGFQQVLDETAAYYVLAWHPEDDAQKGVGFRQIEANIKGRDDLTVRLRRGFYNTPPETVAKTGTKSDRDSSKAKKSKDEKSPLMRALQGLYPRRELPTFVSAGFTDGLPAGRMLTVSVQVDSAALGVEATGAQKTEVDIVGVIIDEQGKTVSDFDQSLTIDPARMSKAQQRHIVYSQQFPTTAGLYQVRVATQDKKSGRAGSAYQWVEVPEIEGAGFTLGSIFVGEVLTDNATQQPMISVHRRFLRSSRFLFQTAVYNAALPPDVGLEVKIFEGGKVVKTLAPRKLMTEGIADLKRIPYIDDFPLDDLPPGRYVLQVTATDRKAKLTSTRRLDFTVE